jgi:hypothetical protein
MRLQVIAKFAVSRRNGLLDAQTWIQTISRLPSSLQGREHSTLGQLRIVPARGNCQGRQRKHREHTRWGSNPGSLHLPLFLLYFTSSIVS